MAELCAAADKSLQGYALEAAEALVSRPEMNRPDPAPGEFGDSVGRTATGIRDVIAEAAARHAVAQVLQTRLLKAPGDLQQVLQGRLATDRLA